MADQNQSYGGGDNNYGYYDNTTGGGGIGGQYSQLVTDPNDPAYWSIPTDLQDYPSQQQQTAGEGSSSSIPADTLYARRKPGRPKKTTGTASSMSMTQEERTRNRAEANKQAQRRLRERRKAERISAFHQERATTTTMEALGGDSRYGTEAQDEIPSFDEEYLPAPTQEELDEMSEEFGEMWWKDFQQQQSQKK